MPKAPAADFDALLADQPTGGGTKLKMIGVLNAIGPDQAAKVTAAAKAKTPDGGRLHSSKRIAAALCAMGHEVSENAVTTWREKLT